MKNRPGLLRKVLPVIGGGLAGLVAGYFLGQSGKETRENPDHQPQSRLVSGLEKGMSQRVAGEKASRQAPPARQPGQVLRLPESVIKLLPGMLHFSGNKVDPSSLRRYGVPEESLRPIEAAINDAMKKMNELAVSRSKVIQVTDGRPSFLIPYCREEGAAVRENLLPTLRFHLTGVEDDRAELLELALTDVTSFSDIQDDRLGMTPAAKAMLSLLMAKHFPESAVEEE